MIAPVAVLTFEPHPRNVFAPGCEPFRLTPFRVKEREIGRLGVDLLFVQQFDLGFAKKTAEAFIDELLVGAIGAGGAEGAEGAHGDRVAAGFGGDVSPVAQGV